MKTIKVIDLLNMIANREYDKLPKKVRFDDEIYYLNEIHYDDGVTYNNEDFQLIGCLKYDGSNLNDKVEIIEDTPKIEHMEYKKCGNGKYFKALADKLNEVIDYINEQDKQE